MYGNFIISVHMSSGEVKQTSVQISLFNLTEVKFQTAVSFPCKQQMPAVK